jgi:glycosyltransferase involved in cell wall biosynthesis
MAGYEIDEKKFPEKVEHLGITPLEAMASGCLVYAYKAGGLKEIIQEGKNGFLFSNKDELFKTMNNIDERKISHIQMHAKKYVYDNFDYSIFAEQVKKILL